MNELIDSPVLSGRWFREIPLAPEISPKHYLDLAADGPEDLEVPPQMLAGFNNLIREASTLYKSHHYDSYHFLMTLSDQVAHFGLEHHQSNDDRVPEKTFLDPNVDMLAAGLLPHEFTHSWNGKYRRPEGLLSPDFQTPMRGNLLWVYEGLTTYLGDVLTARSGTVDAGAVSRCAGRLRGGYGSSSRAHLARPAGYRHRGPRRCMKPRASGITGVAPSIIIPKANWSGSTSTPLFAGRAMVANR